MQLRNYLKLKVFFLCSLAFAFVLTKIISPYEDLMHASLTLMILLVALALMISAMIVSGAILWVYRNHKLYDNGTPIKELE